jgi:hypothetical protein
VNSQREEIAQRRLAFEKRKVALQPLIDSGKAEIVLVPGAAATPPPEAAGSGYTSVALPPSTDAAAPPSDGAP